MRFEAEGSKQRRWDPSQVHNNHQPSERFQNSNLNPLFVKNYESQIFKSCSLNVGDNLLVPYAQKSPTERINTLQYQMLI